MNVASSVGDSTRSTIADTIVDGVETAVAEPAFWEWVDRIQQEFEDLRGHEAGEILDAVLNSTYCTRLTPEGADTATSLTVTRTKVKNIGDNRGRVHASNRCGEISKIDKIASLKTTPWKATQGRDVCHKCVSDPVLLACDDFRGESRRRMEIRNDIVTALRATLAGTTDWTALNRIAVHAGSHVLPRNSDGFLDMADTVTFEPDPAGQAMIALVVRVGRARGEDMAALTDAAVVYELGNQRAMAKGSAVKAVDVAIDRVLAEGTASEPAAGLLKFGERKTQNLISDALLEASVTIEAELEALEDQSDELPEWSKELANGDARPEQNIQARMAMAFHGGLVPSVVVNVLNQTGWNGAAQNDPEAGPRQRW